MEQLWQEFLRAEQRGQPWCDKQAAAQRRAFFFGAWSQFVFQQKLAGLDGATAAKVKRTLELELAREIALCDPESRSADSLVHANRSAETRGQGDLGSASSFMEKVAA